jgi:nucleotide-binding universal stress UspA family protein
MKENRNRVCRKASGAARTLIPELRRVLAATDLSELSNRAIAYAYSMLRSGGVVHIVHVEKPFEFANPIHAPHTVAAQRLEAERLRQLRECRTRLRKLIPVAAEACGIRTEVEVLHQDKPATAICQAAAAWGADVICLASHGRSGLAKAILGSVAHEVLTLSRIPVLVVRSREPETAPIPA